MGGDTAKSLNDVETWGDGSAAIAVGGQVYVKAGTGAPFRLQVLGLGTSTADLNDVEVRNAGADVRIGGDGGVVLFRVGLMSPWTSPKSHTTEAIYKLAFPVDEDHAMAVGQQFLIGAYE